MSRFVFKVDGVDYSHLVAVAGLGWAKNDIEHEKAGRSKTTGNMNRMIVTKKRAIPMTCIMASYEALHPLAVALDKPEVDITILDLIEGEKTYRCYGTKLDSVSCGNVNGCAMFDKLKCDLVEV